MPGNVLIPNPQIYPPSPPRIYLYPTHIFPPRIYNQNQKKPLHMTHHIHAFTSPHTPHPAPSPLAHPDPDATDDASPRHDTRPSADTPPPRPHGDDGAAAPAPAPSRDPCGRRQPRCGAACASSCLRSLPGQARNRPPWRPPFAPFRGPCGDVLFWAVSISSSATLPRRKREWGQEKEENWRASGPRERHENTREYDHGTQGRDEVESDEADDTWWEA